MEVRLKDLHCAAIRDIRSGGRYKPYEKYSKRNDSIMKRLLDMLITGEIDTISLKSDTIFQCLHRSPRKGILVQLSVGRWKEKELVPSYHVDINSFNDLRKEEFPSGIWTTG